MFRKVTIVLSLGLLAAVFAQMRIQAADPPAAAEKAKETEKPKLDSREVIRQALTKKVTWDFCETQLADVLEFLRKDLNIPIRLDAHALSDAGVTPETPISVNMAGISAKTALKLLLSDLSLAYYVEGEVMVISTAEVVDGKLYTVIYNVSEMPAFRRADGKTAPDYENLIHVIAKTIHPTSWDISGGMGSITEYNAGDVQALVVSQTGDVHDEIIDLLNGLRSLSQYPLAKEDIEKLPPLPPPKPHAPQAGMAGMGMGGGMPGMISGGRGMGGMMGSGMPGMGMGGGMGGAMPGMGMGGQAPSSGTPASTPDANKPAAGAPGK
jgi:hypothetical protein